MSSLNDIVQVVISRETTAVARASFGTPGIIAEFDEDYTTVTFDRYRSYASISEMSDDGWTTGDPVYDAAVVLFSQNPTVNSVTVGRKDSADANWGDALTEIQAATEDWYCFMIIANQTSKATFDIDFVTGNSIVFTINGIAVTAIPFNTSNSQTYDDIKTQIEADIADSIVTVNATAKTVLVEIFGQSGVTIMSVVVTGGVSQPVGIITYEQDEDYEAVRTWAETQKKIFFLCSSDVEIYNSGSTTDIAYTTKNGAYDRTVVLFHTNSQGDSSPAYFEAGWIGETLPYDAGSQTWSFKTISGVSTYALTSGQRSAILAKNANIYTTIAKVNNITRQGKVGSGEYIDIIRGIDWLESRLQEEVFSNLINKRKIPFTDEGITLIAGVIQGVLNEAARQGLLVVDSIEITVPLASAVSSADKIARNLPDINFTAVLQGAIHNVEINGTVTV